MGRGEGGAARLRDDELESRDQREGPGPREGVLQDSAADQGFRSEREKHEETEPPGASPKKKAAGKKCPNCPEVTDLREKRHHAVEERRVKRLDGVKKRELVHFRFQGAVSRRAPQGESHSCSWARSIWVPADVGLSAGGPVEKERREVMGKEMIPAGDLHSATQAF